MVSSGIFCLLAFHIFSLLALTSAAEATKGKKLLQINNQVTYDMHTWLAMNILLQQGVGTLSAKTSSHSQD